MSASRGGVEIMARILRSDFVQFNAVPNTPLGVNFDLDVAGQPVVRDALLFYVDTNHNAQIFLGATAGQPESAGLDDDNGDGQADVFGLGLVRQDLNGDGVQDFVDADNNGQADDVNRDTQVDPLWTLTLVHFNRIADVSNPVLWLGGRKLATGAFIRKVVLSGGLTGANIRSFRFSAFHPFGMAYDRAEWGGNVNGTADENELGNIVTADGIINTAVEVAAIDSITLSLMVAQVARQGLGRTTVEIGDIGFDLISPRTLELIKENGLTGLPDPTLASNIR